MPGVITGFSAVAGIAVGVLLTRKREHDADRRKFRPEHYREYVAAFSGVVEGRVIEADAHERYADAVNASMLVGSLRGPKALDALLDETSSQAALPRNARPPAR